MSLPKWMSQESLCDCDGCGYAIRMHNALSIAWEALEWYALMHDGKKLKVTVDRTLAKDAMRRIEELGK